MTINKLNLEQLMFFDKIDVVFPEGIVNGLSKHKRLYQEAKYYAEDFNKTLKEFFESNGYQYLIKDLKDIRKSLRNDLKAYSTKRFSINDLNKQDWSLYNKVLRYATIEDFTLEEYMNVLGFSYNTKKTNRTMLSIKATLNAMYSDKNIIQLSKRNPALYNKVWKYSKKQGKTVNEFLIENGYEIV